MADCARLGVRRDNSDFSEAFKRSRKRMDAVRVDAIIVRNQDSGHRGTVGGKRTDYNNEWLQ
jgi:hypothetical protein